jgi:hypothetical protein
MKITIQSPNEKTIRLGFPTRMIFNRFTAKIGAASIRKYVSTEDTDISSDDLKRLMKEINRIKSKYPDLELVNVESSDGEKVTIRL